MKAVITCLLTLMLGSIQTTPGFAGTLPNELDGLTYGSGKSAPRTLEELKLKKRFGLGFGAGGGLAVLGIEADVNITSDFSISGGIGTGIDYSTFTVKGRYFIPGEWVSPYAAVGFARWWTNGTRETQVGPSVLANKFLEPNQDLSQGFSVFLVYPAVGVQFMHVMGLSIYAELQYLFRLFSFANGTYAGLGAHWYF